MTIHQPDPVREASTAGVLPAGSGRVLLDGPLGATLLAGREQTGGRVALVEHPLAPRTLGSPVHTHRHEDEWTYVVAGHVGIEVAGTASLAGPGDVLLKPRGVPHAFWNPTDEPALLLEIITPGGFEDYFGELGALLSVNGPPDLEALGAVAARYGLDIDVSSVPRLAQQHGLELERS
jgi:quercetin dioxygenase-like cupin family protein